MFEFEGDAFNATEIRSIEHVIDDHDRHQVVFRFKNIGEDGDVEWTYKSEEEAKTKRKEAIAAWRACFE